MLLVVTEKHEEMNLNSNLDIATCVLLTRKLNQNPIILFRSLKNIIENILFEKEHERIHQWIHCLISFQNIQLQWNEDTFYTLLLLISSLPSSSSSLGGSYCDVCISTIIQFLTTENIQEVLDKYLPRILGKLPKNIDIFEWKVLQNYVQFLPITRVIQRNLLSLIRETFIWNNHFFTKQNIESVTSSTLFIIESALSILFTIRKV